MRAPWPAVILQLGKAGYLATDYRRDGPGCLLTLDDTLRSSLQLDERFQCGPWHRLHHVGDDPCDYRGWKGEFGKGSLQIVVDLKTGNAYADVDGFNLQDIVNIAGHTWEVVTGFFRRS